MHAYLVRLIDNRDLVGLFVAPSVDDLRELVDECTEVQYCEYLPLRAGGIFWDSPAVEVPVPDIKNGMPEGEDPYVSVPWNDAALTDHWQTAFYNEMSGWKPLSDEPPHPRPNPEPRRREDNVVPLRKNKPAGL